MGICASCLGLSRRDSNDSESSRLIDDDIYQAGYGYGALNHANQLNQPDPEYLRREREALESICQRASDSVIDIWSLQPQPHLQPRATLQTSSSGSEHDQEIPVTVTTAAPSERPAAAPSDKRGGTVPKHWGEVVINPRKGKKSRPGLNVDEDNNGANVFGVLNVA
ncbi:hypothetical protein PHISCL_01760 [Aspergillus sclerotialis]|uniref:Late endosomal/lysosomal adaptor and MAPK and MTOR activator-domain-containing protein n=1 Tax=Aspergillus sclerotialis TaxID=2070753 RepID=A0A3A2ZRZ9_9EURO|nr:hypothetical protein PHISCL_01760 [Aspergillus sclerotialis]